MDALVEQPYNQTRPATRKQSSLIAQDRTVYAVARDSQKRRDEVSQTDTRYVFTMAVVEKLTGLTRRRIRYYEQRGLVTPSRTAGGHRLYSPSNVETLVRIRNIIGSGITNIEAVDRILAHDLDRVPLAQARPSAKGDAAVRVMRPVPAPLSSARGAETDSLSYFRRVNVLTENERRQSH